MKGAIIVNAFRIPAESIHQAERLKSEFNLLGVTADVIDSGFLSALIENNQLQSSLCAYDFIVYLDKDKYLSGILSKLNVRLFNSHSAIRACDDKGETYIQLANNGLNIPKTMFGALCYRNDCKINKDTAQKIIDNLGLPVIIKESFGSMGKGIYLAKTKEQLLSVMEEVKLKPHLFQEYLSFKRGVDIRVIVIGGKALCAMERKNLDDFRSNVAQGGTGTAINLDEEFKTVAEKASKVLGLDYCGVDLIYGNDGSPYVCEVNSNAFIGGIEKATGVNVAKAYAEYILKTL